MKINLRWFLTGKVTPLKESDDLLNPNTTIAEVKGLIQLRFGFNAREVLLLQDHLLENSDTLKSVGVVGESSDPVIIAHVVRASELENADALESKSAEDDDDSLQEFSHADFILAMRMLGREVAVPDDRLVKLRENAPRQHPAMLNKLAGHTMPPHGQPMAMTKGGQPLPPAGMPGIAAGGGPVGAYNPERTEVYQILLYARHGLRREGVDQKFAIAYPGIEPFPLWDMRNVNQLELDEEPDYQPGELCVELFFFGEFSAIKDRSKFTTLLCNMLETQAGIRVRSCLKLREAGCMYPLVACPVVLHEMDAMELGRILYEDFGTAQSAVPSGLPTDEDVVGEGGGSGCKMQ